MDYLMAPEAKSMIGGSLRYSAFIPFAFDFFVTDPEGGGREGGREGTM